ncbi:sporulation histidine kinase inhibitor Sda [Neobacillus sp. NRS-1170]
MQILSTEQLQEAFNSAIKLNLSKDFIMLLANELNTRIIIESPKSDYRKI